MKSLIFFKRKYLLSEFIIIIIIMISPFLFFLYTICPKDSLIWETSFFLLESNVGNQIENVVWILSYKLLTLVLFGVWYISCKNWWKYLILMMIFIEFHKFFSFLNEELVIFNNYDLFHSSIIIAPILIALIMMSNKYHFFSKRQNLSNEVNNEINILMESLSNFRIKNYIKRKNRLIKLREDKSNISKISYLKNLIQLREDFITKD